MNRWVFLALFLSSSVSYAAPPIVAVFDIKDSSGKFSRRTIDQLSTYLVGQMAEGRRFRVVPRASIRKELSSEKKASYKACYDESCQIEIGKALAAQAALHTEVIKLGKRCILKSTLFDLKAEASIDSAQVREKCNEEGLANAIDRVTAKLAGEKSTGLIKLSSLGGPSASPNAAPVLPKPKHRTTKGPGHPAADAIYVISLPTMVDPKELRSRSPKTQPAVFQAVKTGFSSLVNQGIVSLSVRNGRFTITLASDVCFPAEKTQLTKTCQKHLLSIADAVRSTPELNDVSFAVAVHTDNKGKENELKATSAARARIVRGFLVSPRATGRGGLNHQLWSTCVGFGPIDPVAPNDTNTSRAQNRRVELITL